jgi:TRAP-type C4-dicarboxylate transport system substrate-binding protein
MKSAFLVIGLFVLATLANGAEYKFTLHHFYAPSEPSHTDVLVPWARKVEELSGNQVKITIAPAMQLGGHPSGLTTQVREGKKTDMIWVVNGYSGKEFPRTEVFQMPFVHTNNPVATNLAMHEMYETDLKEDYKGLKLLFLHST